MAQPDAPHVLEPRSSNRALDLSVGIAALIASGPILVAAAVAMRITRDRGPLLYRATRIGEHGRPITVLKLRTMVDGPAAGTGLTQKSDARVTMVGRVLRRYKLDELPQLVNVIRGEMSLVGPRPEDPRYVDWEDPAHRFVFSARPGITGPSQIAFRHEERLLDVPDPEDYYRRVILPAKVAMDADYLRTRTVGSDLRLLGATVRVVLGR